MKRQKRCMLSISANLCCRFEWRWMHHGHWWPFLRINLNCTKVVVAKWCSIPGEYSRIKVTGMFTPQKSLLDFKAPQKMKNRILWWSTCDFNFSSTPSLPGSSTLTNLWSRAWNGSIQWCVKILLGKTSWNKIDGDSWRNPLCTHFFKTLGRRLGWKTGKVDRVTVTMVSRSLQGFAGWI